MDVTTQYTAFIDGQMEESSWSPMMGKDVLKGFECLFQPGARGEWKFLQKFRPPSDSVEEIATFSTLALGVDEIV